MLFDMFHVRLRRPRCKKELRTAWGELTLRGRWLTRHEGCSRISALPFADPVSEQNVFGNYDPDNFIF